MPKGMKIENTVNNFRKKLVTVLEDEESLISVDIMFENDMVCMITGNPKKKNRESFGR